MCGARTISKLEFHHPGKDRKYEAGIVTLSFAQLRRELKRVILVCTTHHALLDEDRHCGEEIGAIPGSPCGNAGSET